MKEKLLALNNIARPISYKKRKIVGRGKASNGCKSGRGSDGQKSRTGDKKPQTEGGQFPSYLRMKKIGFFKKKKKINILKTSDLQKIKDKINSTTITQEEIIKFYKWKSGIKIKLLFNSEVDKDITAHVDYASKSAQKTVNILYTKK